MSKIEILNEFIGLEISGMRPPGAAGTGEELEASTMRFFMMDVKNSELKIDGLKV